MRHRIRVLNYKGDQVVVEWDPKVEEEVKLAEVEFDRLATTMLPYTDTTPAEHITKFNPDVDIIMAPQLQGG
jgi:hypothetical protein